MALQRQVAKARVNEHIRKFCLHSCMAQLLQPVFTMPELLFLKNRPQHLLGKVLAPRKRHKFFSTFYCQNIFSKLAKILITAEQLQNFYANVLATWNGLGSDGGSLAAAASV